MYLYIYIDEYVCIQVSYWEICNPFWESSKKKPREIDIS